MFNDFNVFEEAFRLSKISCELREVDSNVVNIPYMYTTGTAQYDNVPLVHQCQIVKLFQDYEITDQDYVKFILYQCTENIRNQIQLSFENCVKEKVHRMYSNINNAKKWLIKHFCEDRNIRVMEFEKVWIIYDTTKLKCFYHEVCPVQLVDAPEHYVESKLLKFLAYFNFWLADNSAVYIMKE